MCHIVIVSATIVACQGGRTHKSNLCIVAQFLGVVFVFFDILSALCEKDNESPYKLAQTIGLNRSAVARWKNGSIPNGRTLSLMAEHFGVSTDYLLGATADAYLLGTEHQLREAIASYERETDAEKKQELAYAVDVLQEAVEDQKLAIQLSSAQKHGETVGMLQKLRDEDRALLDVAKNMTPEQVRLMTEFARSLKGETN